MKTIAAILFFLLIFTDFIMSSKQPNYQLSKGEELVNSTLAKAAKVIKDKYNHKPCGEGASMPGGPIQKLALCFDTKHPLTKEQLRKLLIETAHELLQQVIEKNEIQEFIKDPPFTINNVEIIIFNNDKDGRDVHDTEISTARISQGKLIYRTSEKSDDFKFNNRFEESYEEALETLSKP